MSTAAGRTQNGTAGDFLSVRWKAGWLSVIV